jgi:hypothetical protein
MCLVARGRFELPSEAPEASMIDRYTTGLFCNMMVSFLPYKSLTNPFLKAKTPKKGLVFIFVTLNWNKKTQIVILIY